MSKGVSLLLVKYPLPSKYLNYYPKFLQFISFPVPEILEESINNLLEDIKSD
jgi:hypothetical protein